MNAEALARLAQNARAFGRAYAAVKESLVAEGVKESEASDVARNAVNMAALWKEESGEPCPMCGRGE